MMTDEQQKRLYELVKQRASWPTFLGAITKGMLTDEDPAMRALGEAVLTTTRTEAQRQGDPRKQQ